MGINVMHWNVKLGDGEMCSCVDDPKTMDGRESFWYLAHELKTDMLQLRIVEDRDGETRTMAQVPWESRSGMIGQAAPWCWTEEVEFLVDMVFTKEARRIALAKWARQEMQKRHGKEMCG